MKLAQLFGYVESTGGKNIKRGDLVPFDHSTSPLNTEEIEELYSHNFKPGVIYPKD